MQLTVDKISALRALRAFRITGAALPTGRCDLPEPSPSPQMRWSLRVLPLERLALDHDQAPSARSPIEVVVPRPELRLRSSFFSCSVRSSSLPESSFVDLGDGLYIPCPELIFYELADIMRPEIHALLAYELCGTYARDPRDPRSGEVRYGIPPVTSVERIARYLDEMGDRPRALIARHSLRCAADNAWSPMEAAIALMARLPVHKLGYELGEVALNMRHGTSPELVALGCKASRVPDIEIVGSHLGFNYDSQLHLNLESVARAGEKGDAADTIRDVRSKYHDDLKRNRELAAQGHVILPVTASDLYTPGGLDAVMLEAALAMRELDGNEGPLHNVLVALEYASDRSKRQELLRLLLPRRSGSSASK